MKEKAQRSFFILHPSSFSCLLYTNFTVKGLTRRQRDFVRFLTAYQRVLNRANPLAMKTDLVSIWLGCSGNPAKSTVKLSVARKPFALIDCSNAAYKIHHNLVDSVLIITEPKLIVTCCIDVV